MCVKVYTATGSGQFVGEAHGPDMLRLMAATAASMGDGKHVHIAGRFDDRTWVVSDVTLRTLETYLAR